MIKRLFATFWILAAFPFAVFAGSLDKPTGDVILTVSGDLEVVNVGSTASFDAQMLAELQDAAFETSTIWTDGVIAFEGVRLKSLLDLIGVKEGMMKMTAINDYSVEVPVTDAVEEGPMLALRMDGKAMSRRDKGPIWLVYPYDHDEIYETQTIQTRSIWQLDRIEVVQ